MNLEQIEEHAIGCRANYCASQAAIDIAQNVIDLIARVRELESENAQLREQTRWRDVREELPPPSDVVLARSKNGGSISAMYAPGMGWDSPLSSIIAHWQPLSQPPKEQL